jgi:hypothetical protein
MELEVFFLQLCNKLNRKHVISFVKRKSSCGYATYFLLFIHKSKKSIDFMLGNSNYGLDRTLFWINRLGFFPIKLEISSFQIK